MVSKNMMLVVSSGKKNERICYINSFYKCCKMVRGCLFFKQVGPLMEFNAYGTPQIMPLPPIQHVLTSLTCI